LLQCGSITRSHVSTRMLAASQRKPPRISITAGRWGRSSPHDDQSKRAGRNAYASFAARVSDDCRRGPGWWPCSRRDSRGNNCSQIRILGFACDKAVSAERDRAALKPNETVWVLKCEDLQLSGAPCSQHGGLPGSDCCEFAWSDGRRLSPTATPRLLPTKICRVYAAQASWLEPGRPCSRSKHVARSRL
jgi:hypothetical protein